VHLDDEKMRNKNPQLTHGAGSEGGKPFSSELGKKKSGNTKAAGGLIELQIWWFLGPEKKGGIWKDCGIEMNASSELFHPDVLLKGAMGKKKKGLGKGGWGT